MARIFLLFVSLSLSCHGQSLASDFTWLTGHWQRVRHSDTIYESWWQKDTQTYLGLAYRLDRPKGDTLIFENLRLSYAGGQWTYTAQVANQNGARPIHFPEVQRGKQFIHFRNAAHDFPQEIRYERREHGPLQATIRGPIQGEMVERVFLYKPYQP